MGVDTITQQPVGPRHPIPPLDDAPVVDSPDVRGSGDPERPIAVRLVDSGSTEKLSRDQAWRLWYLLQAELVRTLPYPPSYPATRITP